MIGRSVLIIQNIKRGKAGRVVLCGQLYAISIAHETAALNLCKIGLALHQHGKLSIQYAARMNMSVQSSKLWRFGEHFHIPLVAQFRFPCRVEIGKAPLPLQLQFIDIAGIVKGFALRANQHGRYVFFSVQVSAHACLRLRGVLGFSPCACSMLAFSASIRAITFPGRFSGGVTISLPAIFASIISRKRA